jgi:cell division protein FtsA
VAKKIITGIDVGTSSVRVVVCEQVRGEDAPHVLAMVSKKSRGLRHGYVVNFDETLNTIREAIIEAEKKSETKINYAILAIGGVGLDSATSHGSVAISRADLEVSDFDVKRAVEACETNLKKTVNKHILQSIPVEFKIDGKKILGRPSGIKGEMLEVKTLFITCVEQHLNDLVAAVEAAGVSVEEVVASPIASSFVTLNHIQKTAGCILVDIGAETVSLAVFEEGVPISLRVFSIGATDITNDIALGLKISIEEAEDLKVTNMSGSFSKRKLDEIIAARLSDIFDLIGAHLKKIGKNELLPAGVIMIGGGSNTSIIGPMAKEILNLPVRIANVSVIMNAGRTPQPALVKKDIESCWAVAYGLCVMGIDPDANLSFGTELARQTKKNVIKWLKQFLP